MNMKESHGRILSDLCFRTRSGGGEGLSPIGVNFSGLPLCKAGVWGMQSSKNILFSSFFAAKPRKKKKKTGLGLPPQSHETVTLTPMGFRPPHFPSG
jgi:hypothetical protein